MVQRNMRGRDWRCLVVLASLCWIVVATDPLRGYVEAQRETGATFAGVVRGARPAVFSGAIDNIQLERLQAESEKLGLTYEQNLVEPTTEISVETPAQDFKLDISRIASFAEDVREEERHSESTNGSDDNVELPFAHSRFQKVQNTYKFPFSAVTKIYFSAAPSCTESCNEFGKTLGSCSGVVIGKYHVLTAAHCVYQNSTKTLNQNMFFVPAMNDVLKPIAAPAPSAATEKPFGVARSKKVTFFGYPNATNVVSALSSDYALIMLDRPLSSGVIPPRRKLVKSGTKLDLVGYSGSMYDGKFQRRRRGSLTFVNDRIVVADVDICSGDSGSSAWTINKRQFAVVSSTSGGNCGLGSSCCGNRGFFTHINPYRHRDLRRRIRADLRDSRPPDRPYVVQYANIPTVSHRQVASLSGQQFKSGQEVNVTLSLVNRGQAPSGPIVISFYWSPKPSFDNLDPFMKNNFDSFLYEAGLPMNTFRTIRGRIRVPTRPKRGSVVHIFALANASKKEYDKDITAHTIFIGSVKIT